MGWKNLTIQTNSVVHSIIYDNAKQRAVGVRVIDAITKETKDYFSKIIFVNASALNTNLILLNSKSERFPNGLGNDSGLLGKYICHHNYRVYMNGRMDGFMDKYYSGRNPTEAIIANYRNLDKQDTDFKGGYTTFAGAYRERLDSSTTSATIGSHFKTALEEPGYWHVYAICRERPFPNSKTMLG